MLSWDDLNIRRTTQPLSRASLTAPGWKNRREWTDWTDWTAAEKSRLAMLRQQVQTDGNYREFGLDQRQLEFVRWLVVHGKLREDL